MAVGPSGDRPGLPRRWRPRRRRLALARETRPPFPDARVIRGVVAALALVLGAYCLLAAATVLSAQTPPGSPNPAELAARERYQWPGWIPVVFLALVALYAVVIAARRRGRARRRAGPPSTQDPPIAPPEPGRHRDSASR